MRRFTNDPTEWTRVSPDELTTDEGFFRREASLWKFYSILSTFLLLATVLCIVFYSSGRRTTAAEISGVVRVEVGNQMDAKMFQDSGFPSQHRGPTYQDASGHSRFEASKVKRRNMRKVRTSLAAALLVITLAACTNWERNTYNTLATLKSALDCAATAYNHDIPGIQKACGGPGVVITVTQAQALFLPQTKTNHDILDKAQRAQNIAVDAFKVYLYAKAGGQGDLTTLQMNVMNAVTQLTLDILNVKQMAAKAVTQ